MCAFHAEQAAEAESCIWPGQSCSSSTPCSWAESTEGQPPTPGSPHIHRDSTDFTPWLSSESPSFLPDLETTVVVRLVTWEWEEVIPGSLWTGAAFSLPFRLPCKAPGCGGRQSAVPRSSQFPPNSILLLSKFTPSKKLWGWMEPDFLPGSLQASHTADYLLHFHLSAVVLCLSFLVSDFPSLFCIFH